MAARATRIGAVPTLVVLACVLAGVGATVSGAGPSASANRPGDGARLEAPVDGGGSHDLSLPEMQGPGLDGGAGQGGQEVAVQSVKTGGTQVVVGSGDLGIPARILTAYRSAAAATARTDAACGLPWTLLASIGRIESGHARGGAVDSAGRTLSPILGPVLSGGPGIAAIRDSDDGRFDGDRVWDRAVGPMQFIPTSWTRYSRDGNGDGRADPHNVDDAALASAGYLCAGDRDLRDRGALRRAVFGYNHSWDYVATVLAWMDAYDEGQVVGTSGVTAAGSGGDARTAPVVAASRREPSPSRTATARPAPTARPAATATPAPSQSPTSTPTSAVTPTPTTTPTASPTPTPTGCPTASPTPTPTPTDGTTPTPTPTPTSTASPTPTPSGSTTPDPCAPDPADGADPADPISEPTSSQSPGAGEGT